VIGGWDNYRVRLEGMKITPPLIDALSFPLTVAYGIHLAKFDECKELNVIIMGATEKAEQRIFIESDYYQEILVLLPNIERLNAYLVGPEISIGMHLQTVKKTDKFKGYFYKGKLMEFFKEMGIGLNPKNTLLIGLNTGLGMKHAGLIMSWLKDLKFFIKKKYTMIFTSSNDYEDLAGETHIMTNILQANYVIQVAKNPFCGMTRYHLPGKEETVISFISP